MAEIINISEYKIESRGKKTFAPWKKRFKEDFDYFTRLSDLSDKILMSLADDGKTSETALREIVMAFLNLGPASKFPFLSDDEQWLIVRLTLFLKAQIFFEIMLRLGWVVEYPCQRYSLTSIIESSWKGYGFQNRAMPVLSESLQESSTYEKLSPEFRIKFLEERFERAFALFDKKIKNKGDK